MTMNEDKARLILSNIECMTRISAEKEYPRTFAGILRGAAWGAVLWGIIIVAALLSGCDKPLKRDESQMLMCRPVQNVIKLRANEGWQIIYQEYDAPLEKRLKAGAVQVEFHPGALRCAYFVNGTPRVDVPAGIWFYRSNPK